MAGYMSEARVREVVNEEWARLVDERRELLEEGLHDPGDVLHDGRWEPYGDVLKLRATRSEFELWTDLADRAGDSFSVFARKLFNAEVLRARGLVAHGDSGLRVDGEGRVVNSERA